MLFYSKSKYLLAFCLVLAFICCCHRVERSPLDLATINEKNLDYRLDIQNRRTFHPGEDVNPVDINMDGVDELVLISNSQIIDNPSYMQIMSADFYQVWLRNNYRGQIFLPIVLDLDLDQHNELVFSESRGDSTLIHVLNRKGSPIASFVAAVNPHSSNQKWLCACSGIAAMDVNQDGYQDLIYALNTSYAYQPRGVFAFDVRHNRQLWEYRTGFIPFGLLLTDTNHDGRQEIICGSSAPQNGVGQMINGTDDATVYFTILNSLGQPLMSHRFREDYNILRILPHDFDRDGDDDLFFIASSMRVRHELSSVIGKIDTDRYQPSILSEFNHTSAPLMSIISLPQERNDRLLIYSLDGLVEIRTPQLKLLRSRKLIDFHDISCAVGEDLDGDKIPEILLTGSQNNYSFCAILDLGLSLKSLLRFNYGASFSQPSLLHTGSKHPARLILQCDENLYVLQLKKQLAAYLPLPASWLIGLAIISLVGFVLWLLGRLHRVRMTSGVQALQNLFNHLRECIIILSHDGRVLQFNQEIVHLGIPATEQTLGQTYASLFVQTDLTDVVEMLDKAYKDKLPLMKKEISLLQRSQSVNLIVYVALFPFGAIQSPGRIILIRQITEVVEHERELAWASMANRLAHELKSPLSTIRLSAQEIRPDPGDLPGVAEKNSKYVHHILQQVDRLGKTAENFLKFARVSQAVFKPIDINDLFLRCFEGIEMKINPKVQVTTSFESQQLFINADEDMILIALQNLIENSLRAMPNGGKLLVRTRMVKTRKVMNETSHARIGIADTGIGMNKEYIQQLFQPFVSHSAGGTGLGLVIVQKIIKDHEGQLAVRSALGKGTVVTITLPALDTYASAEKRLHPGSID